MRASAGLDAALSRAALDRDYDARASVPEPVFAAAMARYRGGSEAARRTVPGRLDLVYDAASGQALDLFGIADEPRPVFLFIHGGYWRALSKADSAFMAEALAARGIATAVVDYRLAPAVTLGEIVREVRAALAFLWHRGAAFGVDPARIVVGGSSAGGHLAASLVAGGWHADFGVPETAVKGALPISGLFDLAPVARCFANEWARLGPADVAALSPARQLPRAGCPIVVALAEGEPAGFRRQSEAFHRLWRGAGFASTLLTVGGRNHFDVVLDLADPGTALFKALLALVDRQGIGPASPARDPLVLPVERTSDEIR